VNAAGTQITIAFTQDLASNIAPKEQFAVTVGTPAALTTQTVAVPVTEVALTGPRVITLTLGGIIDSNKPPKVAYTAPANVAGTGNFALQNTLGEDVANFSVVSGGTQSSVPALLASPAPAVQAAGNTILLTYNLTLADAPALPEPGAFAVTANGANNPVVAVTRPSNTTVLLRMRDGVPASTAVTLSYAAPAADNASATNLAVQGTSGVDAQSFSNITVTNTASLVPAFASALITAAGNVMTVNFSQDLATAMPGASAFSVSVAGSSNAVTTVTRTSARVVTLGLTSGVATGSTVTLSYSAPAADNSSTTNLALQSSVAGVDMVS
jgi:uncharacterized repeat protein (TIGR02059 family)